MRVVRRNGDCQNEARMMRIRLPLPAASFILFSSRRRHTIFDCDWSSDVCSSDLRPRWRRPANPGDAGAVRSVKDWQVVASAAGIEARPFEVDKPDGFEEAFAGMARARADTLVVVGDALMFSSRARIVSLASKNRLPAMYPQKEYVNAGGLISYGTDLADVFRRSAGFVDKILKGANPAELAVELPTKYELAINLATAKVLGLTIPASLRAKVDVLVE